ncbi:MAG: tetratricopeptide repeat protein [Myxococcota bacterium]
MERGSPRLQFLYGRALWATSRPGLAIWALKGAMRDPEQLVPAGKLLVNAFITAEAWADAESVCDAMLDEVGDDPEILTLRAFARQGSRRNYQGAIDDADRALELDPNRRDALIPRTVALLALERVEEAGEALRQLDEIYRDEKLGFKGSAKFCTAGATFALEKGEPDLALERFDRCLEEFPSNPLLLSKALEFFDGRGESDRSIEIIRKALDLEPTAVQMRENLALRLEAAGRHDEAVAVLEEATQQPSTVGQAQAWAALAGFHAATGGIEAAIEAYDEARKRLTSRSPELDFRYADALIHAGRHEEALDFAAELTVLPHRLLIEGRALLELDRPAEALEKLGEGNRLWPNNAVARYYTAVAAEQTGDLNRAIEDYRYSVRVDPAATDAPLRLAHYYVAIGSDAHALNALSVGQTDNPQAIQMQVMAARIMAYHGQGPEVQRRFAASFRYPQLRSLMVAAIADGIRDRNGATIALDFLEHVESLDLTHPLNGPLLTRLVEWRIEAGRAADALELAQDASESHPDTPLFEALVGAALGALADGPEKGAQERFERALELEPDQPIALRGLASQRARLGDIDGAVALYRRAIAAEPEDARASIALAELLERSHRPKEAIDVFADLFKRRPWDPEASLRLAQALLNDDDDATRRARARTLVGWADALRRGPSNPAGELDALRARLDGRS